MLATGDGAVTNTIVVLVLGPAAADEDGTAGAVTVRKTVLTTVAVDVAEGVDEDGGCVTVTTAVLMTVAVETLTETEGDGGGEAEPSEEVADESVPEDAELAILPGIDDDVALELDNGVLDIDAAVEEALKVVCAGFDIPRNGVGTTVEFGLGGGIPDGYESEKMSFCAPSLKLYMSKYLGGE